MGQAGRTPIGCDTVVERMGRLLDRTTCLDLWTVAAKRKGTPS